MSSATSHLISIKCHLMPECFDVCRVGLESNGAQKKEFSAAEVRILVEERTILKLKGCVHPAKVGLYVRKY